MHAEQLVDMDLLAVMDRRALNEPLREAAELACGVVAHQQLAIRARVEIEGRHVRARIELTHLWMNDVVEREEEGACGRVSLEELWISVGQQRQGRATKP